MFSVIKITITHKERHKGLVFELHSSTHMKIIDKEIQLRYSSSLTLKYEFQSESTFYSCLNVKEFLARSRREIWSLSDCNWTRTHNHLVRKQTLNHLVKLAKWLSWAVLWVLICTVHLTACSCHVTHPQSFGQFGWMVECSFKK